MEAKKITLRDIEFHIQRLTEALDTFNSQIKDDKIVYLDYEPPQKVKQHDSKIDEDVRRILRSKATLYEKMEMPKEFIKPLLNPSPTEFQEHKAKYIESEKKRRKEQAEQRLSEKNQLKSIDNHQPLHYQKLRIEDIKSNFIIIFSYDEYSAYYGRIGQITTSIQFPLSIYKIKNDLSMGVIPMEVESLNQIKALVDSSLVSKKLNKYLLELAIKYRIPFDGLVYSANWRPKW
ncbi:MAG TPA: hypothetical protein VGE44_14490 [Daejeonella sp.]|uniref:hypothetical protein n=1 Tax=Daejeonella sp. TaxID=2805397 RepID=UPI002EDB447A